MKHTRSHQPARAITFAQSKCRRGHSSWEAIFPGRFPAPSLIASHWVTSTPSAPGGALGIAPRMRS